MFIRAIVVVFVLSLIFASAGCATAKKGAVEEDLRNQVAGLEKQVKDKDQEISDLRDALSAVLDEKETLGKKSTISETKSKPSTKQIQIALKNAGFNPGPIDGKMGKQTQDALKAFQKANGLTVDGRCGKNTWAILGEYIEKKVK